MGSASDRRRARERMQEFEMLTRNAEPFLYRVAFRLTGNYDDARDLLQEALLEAFRAFGSFQPGAQFERWVVRIMTNTYIDHRRRRTRGLEAIPMAELSRPDDDGSEIELADRSTGPEERVIAGEFRLLLQAVLNRLPAEYSTTFVLCDMEEFSYTEAAQIMGCPQGTVRSRLYRARHAIRRYLSPYLDEYEDTSSAKIIDRAGEQTWTVDVQENS